MATPIYAARLLFYATMSLLAIVGVALAYEDELKDLAEKLVAQLEAAEQISGTVLDFTDLQGQPNELGRFLAQELSDKLVATSKTMSFLDRAGLQYLLSENKLSAEGLVDPKTTRKLGNLIGIDTLIVGTATPLGRNIRLSVRAIAVETSKIVGSQSATLPESEELADLFTRGVASSSVGITSNNDAADDMPDTRARFRADSIKVSSKKVVESNDSVTTTLMIENKSGIGISIGLLYGTTAIGSCNTILHVSGVQEYDNRALAQIEEDKSYSSSLSFLPAGGKIGIGLTATTQSYPSCTPTGDVSASLIVAAQGDVFQLPISVTDVPISKTER